MCYRLLGEAGAGPIKTSACKMGDGGLTSEGTQTRQFGATFVFREHGHMLIALDAQGNLLSKGPDKKRRWPKEPAISRNRVSTGNTEIDRTIASMLKACREYDERPPSPLPPSASTRRRDGTAVLVDVFLIPEPLRTALEGARFMLVVRETAGGPESRTSEMRRKFGLTAAEAELANLLAQGMSLQDVSEHLSISIWTARSHLNAIFQKTDTHRQGELIALINHTVH